VGGDGKDVVSELDKSRESVVRPSRHQVAVRRGSKVDHSHQSARSVQ